MRNIRNQHRPHFVGDGAKALEIDHARIGGISTKNDLGFVLKREFFDRIVVDVTVVGA